MSNFNLDCFKDFDPLPYLGFAAGVILGDNAKGASQGCSGGLTGALVATAC